MNVETSFQLTGVTVDFPVYSADSRSLKNDLLRKGTGGRIACTAESRVSVRGAGGRESRVRAWRPGRPDRHQRLRQDDAAAGARGRLPADVGVVRRRGQVSSLFDWSLGIDPGATGYENIMIRGIFLGLTPAEVRERTGEIAAFTELGDYLAMPMHTYSTGMKLRLALAVCTCIEPQILLMDEWIGLGDAAFVEKAGRRLEELVNRAGILVLASHNPALLERNCTTGVLLDAGRVRASGPIGEVLREYGKMNH